MKIVDNGLNVDIYRDLRKTGPFMDYDDQDIEISLKNSLYTVVIYDQEQPVAIGRLVGDNRITFFLKDVVVLPEYRGKGVGKLLMNSLMNYIKDHAVDNAYIGLNSTLGCEGFYKNFGFIPRPNETLGSGMSQYYKKKRCD